MHPGVRPTHGYANDDIWPGLQAFLPEALRLYDDTLPTETFWPWRGHAVHLDRFTQPDSPVTVILLHGVGTNGRQLSLVVGGPLARRGFETVAVDLPTYGKTRVVPGALVTYDDWVDLVVELIAAERARADRPVVLYGLSAGGMLAYHAAAVSRQVAGVIGTTFLDQRLQIVRDATSLNQVMSRVGGGLTFWAADTPLRGLRMPMRLAAKMHTLVNNPDALRLLLTDPTAAGNWASLAFLASYLQYQPAVEPEAFDVCPILLTQPAADRWTPRDLSDLVLRRIRCVSVTVAMLDGAGHYPLEQPGLTQMAEAITTFIRDLPGAGNRREGVVSPQVQ